jgi:dihydroneopterin aldolase
MDRVFIRDLRIDTVIGVYAWERRITQTLSLDLDLAADNRVAAREDDIGDAVDYAAVSRALTAFGKASDFNLVETFAERAAELVMAEFGIPWLRLAVTKTVAIEGTVKVGVVIERGEEPAHG